MAGGHNSGIEGVRLVYYAAYGSNLSRERFDIYLRGGVPSGASHAYPGCRDPSSPRDDRPWECDCELRFGGRSKTWGGGVALVGPGPSDVATKLRLYLVTLEQFEDVVAQENWLEPGSIELTDAQYDPHHVIGADHMYRVVLQLGELDDVPVLTITQDAAVPVAAPTVSYLRHIAQGLREAHGCDIAQIAEYLSDRPGVAGAFPQDDLVSLLAEA